MSFSRMQTTVLAGCALLGCRAVQGLVDTGSVLDLFSETGARPVAGESRCSFSYTPSRSDWVSGIDEEQVFLAYIQGDGWRLGIGKGGQIYSLRGPFGESVAPQRVTSPWNDEVWQVVVTSEELIGPIHRYQNANPSQRTTTGPLMYFIHQSGIYVQAEGTDGDRMMEPFYSPCLRKRWNPETRTLELVNWMQQAHTPCVWKSGVLIYTAYRDLGEGLIEANQVLHNFGTESLGFLNAPWGGVRHSNLPHAVISNPDGSWERAEGVWNWTGIPTRNVIETGGWEAWVQDPEDESSPALALVFGADREDSSNGKRENGAIRWGRAGNAARDYQVTERVSRITVSPGDSISIRWYLVSGKFASVRKRAASVSDRAGVSRTSFKRTIRQRVWLNDEAVLTEGEGSAWIELYAFPAEGTVPIFLLKDRRTGKQTIAADPYALADTEPFPNPLPKELKIHNLYNNRMIYNQHRPHIGYENLLGYAFVEPPTGLEVQRIPAAAGVNLHSSAAAVWIPHMQPQD